jgi:hypothetical protein
LSVSVRPRGHRPGAVRGLRSEDVPRVHAAERADLDHRARSRRWATQGPTCGHPQGMAEADPQRAFATRRVQLHHREPGDGALRPGGSLTLVFAQPRTRHQQEGVEGRGGGFEHSEVRPVSSIGTENRRKESRPASLPGFELDEQVRWQRCPTLSVK